jgi:hypothetical protein
MGDRGHYRMVRGWMEHPLLVADDPFSKREAWCWLIEQAAYYPKQHRFGTLNVNAEDDWRSRYARTPIL